MSSLSLNQKWNSTTDFIDPWSITSEGVHHQIKLTQNTYPEPSMWSNTWDMNTSNVKKFHDDFTPKSKITESQNTFYHVVSGQDWDTLVAPKKTQKKIPQKTYTSHDNWINVGENSDAWTTHENAEDKESSTSMLSTSPKKSPSTSIEEELGHQSRYKTELCRSWSDTGNCRYGVKCQFAHGREELRPVLRHPKYKTELCRSWTETGNCPYGKRCRFIHTEEEVPDSVISPLFPMTPVPYTKEVEETPKMVKDDTTPKKKSRLPFFQELCL